MPIWEYVKGRGPFTPLDHVTLDEIAMNLYAQLNFSGNCEEAFRFYHRNSISRS
jgi:hypothetical protein